MTATTTAAAAAAPGRRTSMADDNRGVSVVSPPPPPPPPPSLPSPPLLATVVALRARRAVVSGAHRVHMYATYLLPFSEINKQCRGHSSCTPGKTVPCLVFLASPFWLHAYPPIPRYRCSPRHRPDCRFGCTRLDSEPHVERQCQSVPEVNRFPNRCQELAFSGRKCSILSEHFFLSPFLLVSLS